MNKLFEPIAMARGSLPWDYRIYSDRDFKGYYHWHQVCEIVYVHEGTGSIVLNGRAYGIKRGMLFFFQPFQLHHIHADVSERQPYIRSIFYADPIQISEMLRPFPKRFARFNSLLQNRQRDHAYDLCGMEEVMEWIYEKYDRHRKRRGGKEEAEEITLLFLELMSVLEKADAPAIEDNREEELRRPRRYSEAAMRWVEEHYAEEFRLERLADELHLSRYYLSRLFRQETGSAITDYVTARRMKQACMLLETTELSVDQIGFRVGIPNVSYFIQLFKRVVGTTPLKYRRSGANPED